MSISKRRFRWSTYSVLGATFLGAVLLAKLFPPDSLLALVGGWAGVAALIGALVQIARDEAAHQKNVDLQEHQQLFSLGATTHMADVAFDKHIAFCEEYWSEVNSTVATLFREGPVKDALTHSGNLYRIRLKHSAWLTSEIESQLEPFEMALRTIGSAAHMYALNPGNANSSGAVDRMFDTFSDVLSLGKDEGKPVNAEIATSTVLSRLRGILGTDQLTKLRTRLLNSAAARGA